MVTCIIVDDEAYSIDTLSEYIKKADTLKLIGTYADPLSALEAIQKGEMPQLVFMDIDMPNISGIELARLIPQHIPIIYITAFSGYALQTFETNVYDFLLKPVSFPSFIKSLNKFFTRSALPVVSESPSPNEVMESPVNYIFINPGVKGKLIKIHYDDILYVEGLKNFVVIYVKAGKHTIYLTMTELEHALPATRFIRIHKSYIINLDRIQSVEGNTVVISEHLRFPLGGTHKERLLALLKKSTLLSGR